MNGQELPPGFDAERVRAHIAESHANFEELERAWDRLVAEREGQWVAAQAGQFLFATSLEDVVALARAADWPVDVMAVGHLAKKRATVLL